MKLKAENKYWREQLHQATLPQNRGSNIEEISTQLREVKDWIHDTIQDGRNFLPSFVSTFRSLVAIRDKFRIFEGEWKDFLPVKDLTIPRLATSFTLLSDRLRWTTFWFHLLISKVYPRLCNFLKFSLYHNLVCKSTVLVTTSKEGF